MKEELHIAGHPFSGQKQARELVSRSLAGDRLPHAYLFRGPEGVGKQLFARGLAAAINCKKSNGLNACGECSSCVKFAADSHPDFVAISPEKGAIKIGRIRQLIEALSFAPYEAELRVVLIEDVHTMRQEAANSLLKTLEEPPENNLLILTADSSGALLPTIISRCQVVPFYALTVPQTTGILLAEEPEMDEETAQLLARLAEGSPGRALLFHRRQLVEFCRELVSLFADPDISGDRAVGRLLQMAEAMAALKEDLPRLLGLVRLWLRDGLLEGVGLGGEGGFWITRKDWNNKQYFAKLQAVDRAEKELGRNCNRTLVCEVLLFQLNS